ncbi:MAG: hypothetical protein L3J38_07760, partial [Thiomicrorhabdus sp.]|nr:hypothetical protein [Thiomicrorhabdus sp.]
MSNAPIAPKPSNNPYGNTANTGGSEALLLDWIIKEIIDQGFLGVHTWATIVQKITSKNYY